MDSKNLEFEIAEGYTLLKPRVLGPHELDHLPSFVEDLLLQKKQEMVLSLVNIETVFSSHLTAFVQVYRLLKSFNLRFVVVDISPAVLNVLQMTQLDSLLPLLLSIQDYKDSVVGTNPTVASDVPLDFSYQINGSIVRCIGYMAFGEKVRRLQMDLDSKPSIVFEIADVGYMDTRVLIMISDLAARSKVEIKGASAVIRELFEQHRLQNKVAFVD